MERWREPWIEQNPNTKNWFLRWRERGEDGLVHRRGRLCESKSDALKMKDVKRDELRETRRTTHNPEALIRPLYDNYMREMETVRHLRPGSLRSKNHSVIPFIEKAVTMGKLSREFIRDYRDALIEETELSPVTIAIRMREIKAFVRWLHFEGHLKENPWVKIELPAYDAKPRFLTEPELARLEEHSAGQLKAIVRMAYLTGMRVNEILTALWEDVSWVRQEAPDGKTVTRAFLTIRSETAKNSRSRTVPLRVDVANLLGSRRETGPLFEGWDKHKLRYHWDRLKEKAGFTDRVRFHDLRHTFCKLYLQGGGTIADLMQITGHQSIVMMQIYAHFEVRYKTDRIDQIYLPDLTRGSKGRLKDNTPNFEVTEGDKEKQQETEKHGEDDDNSAGSMAVL